MYTYIYIYYEIYLFGKISPIIIHGKIIIDDPKNELLHNITMGIKGIGPM